MFAEAMGRAEVLDEVLAWLDAAQVVVLVGPPGIGKSNLAAALRAEAWVSVESLASPDDLVGRAARTLGCAVERPEAVLEELDQVDLVVLDGYDLGPHDLDDLLRSWSAHTRIVVTSRSHLPEWPAHVEVGPLSPEAGAAALRAHLRDRRRADALDQGALEALSEALDGVPLALAMVADRLRLYEPEVLLAKVQALGRGDAPAGSLGDALTDALSLRLGSLSDAARTVIAAAAGLPGWFDVATLAAVVDADVDDAVLELLDGSLLQSNQGAPPQLRLLAPVRAAVLHDADPQQLAEGMARLAAHLLPEAEAAAAGGTPGDLARLGELREQLDALTRGEDAATCLRAALCLGARERRTGPAQAILARDEQLAGRGPVDLQVRWGLMVARTALGALKPEVAEPILARLEPLFDEDTRADERSLRSFLALVQGDPQRSAELAREAIALRAEPHFYLRLGVACFELEEQDEAATSFQHARHDSDPFRRGHATYGLCTALLEKRSPPSEVLQLVREAEAEDALAYPWLACRLHFLRAVAFAALGRFDEAQQQYAQAGRMHRILGEAPSELFMELNARMLDFAAGRVPESLLTLRVAPTAFGRPMLTVLRAVTHAVLGHHDAAEAMGAPAVAALQERSAREARWAGCMLAVAFATTRPEVAASFLPEGDEHPVGLARRVLAGEIPPPDGSVEQRVFAGIVGLTRQGAVVARDGTAFVGEDGQRVDIARRRVLRRVLQTLATADAPLDVEGICALVWPGERLVAQSGTRRVHVAISTLRGLGLRSAIQTDVTGSVTTWRLDADVVEGV